MTDLNIILAFFAKHGTNEKILLPLPKDQIGDAMKHLNEKFGGNWVYCERLKGNGEFIKFTDDLIYLGFDSKIDRYCTLIQKL